MGGARRLYTLLALVATYPFAAQWNLTGQPAIAVPAGTTEDGLPVGVELVGRPGEEARMIALAAQLESELAWPARRPPLS